MAEPILHRLRVILRWQICTAVAMAICSVIRAMG